MTEKSQLLPQTILNHNDGCHGDHVAFERALCAEADNLLALADRFCDFQVNMTSEVTHLITSLRGAGLACKAFRERCDKLKTRK
jgi:hypothetical protein